MSRNRGKKRLTLGFLVDWTAKDYQMRIIFGAVDAAKAYDVNLICVEGGCIHSKLEYEIRHNFLYDLVNERNVDGIIVLSPAIGFHATREQVAAFCRRYHPLPVVSIAQEIEGCGSVLIDNYTGLRELIVHLLEVHRYRRFALIAGPKDNEDAAIRLETIKKTLREYDVGLDENLIVHGEFSASTSSGAEAVKTLINERKADFDVLIAASDNIAWNALKELQSRKIKVPEDIAVVGFDNFSFSAYSYPPLTTVNQSLHEQGFRAVELLLDMIEGKETPRKIVVPTRLVIRESCGCFSQATRISALEDNHCDGEKSTTVPPLKKEAIVSEAVKRTLSVFNNEGKSLNLYELTERLFDALDQESSKKKGEFLKVFSETLHQTLRTDENVFLWQNILAEIRCRLLPYITEREALIRLENLFHQACMMIGEKAVEREKINYHESLQNNAVLNRISEELLSAFSVNQLVEILAQTVPQMGISSCFISKFAGNRLEARTRQRLILACNKKGRLNTRKAGTYSDAPVPEIILDDGEQHALVVMLLSFSQILFGLIGLELDLRNADIYGALRRIVCSSLNGVILTKQIKEQEKKLLAQEYQKNLAETKKAMEGFIRTILLMVEMRDPYTAGHQNRVAALAYAIAVEMGLPREMAEGVRIAGIMHDVGKISVPVEILNKPGRLKKAEFDLIKEHSQIAYDILKNVEFPWPIARTILQHHERMDGSGYPNGLKGEEIELEARILAVADVIEAMASHRPYRPALGIEKALQEISEHRGTLYDSEVVDACVRLFKEKGYKLI